MKRLLLMCLAALLTLAVVGMASATGPQNEFAAGSAKTETNVLVTGEHASFSVHNVPGPSCEASGKIVYKAAVSAFTGGPFEFEARLTRLVINDFGTQAEAFFSGPITRVKEGPQSFVGLIAVFDAVDSGLGGGMGDQFLFEAIGNFEPACTNPVFPSEPITQGNIVIKATGPLP